MIYRNKIESSFITALCALYGHTIGFTLHENLDSLTILTSLLFAAWYPATELYSYESDPESFNPLPRALIALIAVAAGIALSTI